MATTLINAVSGITNIQKTYVNGVDSLIIPGLGPCTITAPDNATTQALGITTTFTMTLTTP